MGNPINKIPAKFTVTNEISDTDVRYYKVSIDLLCVGENLNGSYFSKEVVDQNIDSIMNMPILGFIEYDKLSGENDFEGHKFIKVRSDDEIVDKFIGSAYGTIPESCNPRWVDKEAPDGTIKPYLRVDGLLWSRFDDAVDIMVRDGEKDQSIELEISSVDGYVDEEDSLFHFTKFQFSGATILGSRVQPAMPGACVTLNDTKFSVDLQEFTKTIKDELSERFTAFSRLIDDTNDDNHGGKGKVADTNFAQTIKGQLSDISNIVSNHEKILDDWGYEYSRYVLVDIYDSEVIVYDAKDNWNLYGLAFTMDGDSPVIDFENAKRKKCVYEDYETGSDAEEPVFVFDMANCINKVVDNANTKMSEMKTTADEEVNDITTKFEEAEAKTKETTDALVALQGAFDEMKVKYEAFVEEADARKAQEELDAKNSIFAQFDAELSDNSEYNELKDNMANFSVDDIENKCALMYTKKNLNFSKMNNGYKSNVGVPDVDHDDDGLYKNSRYGVIHVNRN